jgi:hypothetical protein
LFVKPPRDEKDRITEGGKEPSKRESHLTSLHHHPSPADAVNAGAATSSPSSHRRRRRHGHGAVRSGSAGFSRRDPISLLPSIKKGANKAGDSRNYAGRIHQGAPPIWSPARHAGFFLTFLADRSTPRILFLFPFLSFLPRGSGGFRKPVVRRRAARPPLIFFQVNSPAVSPSPRSSPLPDLALRSSVLDFVAGGAIGGGRVIGKGVILIC